MSRCLALVAVVGLAACASQPRWRTIRQPDALDAAAALGDDSRGLEREPRAEEVPVVPVRQRLRPCCAFGSQLQVRVGMLAIPGISIGNIRSPDGIGNHNYDVGQRGNDVAEGAEENGLVYTCRGGFIDTAHVRDYADWTLFLASAIGRHLETGAVIDLPGEEGGRRRFVLEPVDPELLHVYGRQSLSSSLAVWAAFQLSIWHEIATWYGWASFGAFPERVSAFSPEDLYSNLLGAKLVVPIIESNGAGSEDLFDRSIDAWLAQGLRFLGAVDAELGEAAMRSVDGIWWNSSARLPDDDLVLRRNLQVGSTIQPWLVPLRPSDSELREQLHEACGDDPTPNLLRNPSRIPGLGFDDVVRFEVDLSDALARQPTFLEIGPRVTQADFPRILERIQEEVLVEFGPLGDGPAPAP